MSNPIEWLSEKEAERLSLSEFVRAARRTLQERFEESNRWTLAQFGEQVQSLMHEQQNPPASELHLSLYDRKFLKGIQIKVDDYKANPHIEEA
jgi:hypothetical protein